MISRNLIWGPPCHQLRVEELIKRILPFPRTSAYARIVRPIRNDWGTIAASNVASELLAASQYRLAISGDCIEQCKCQDACMCYSSKINGQVAGDVGEKSGFARAALCDNLI